MAILRVVGVVVGLTIPVLAAAPPPSISAATSRLSIATRQELPVVIPSSEEQERGPIAQPMSGLSARAGIAAGMQEPQANGAAAFGAEMTRLSVEADAVDRLWQGFKTQCGVQMHDEYGFGREWFSIWDLKAEATVESAPCRDMLRGVVLAGKNVRRDLLRARKAAQRATLDRGTEVGLLRWHGLEWTTPSN